MFGTMRCCFALLACSVLGCSTAGASDFPQKPVRFVVGYAPGGGTDVLARVIGRKLSDAWGQGVVVENRPGGGGIIAANLVRMRRPMGTRYS